MVDPGFGNPVAVLRLRALQQTRDALKFHESKLRHAAETLRRPPTGASCHSTRPTSDSAVTVVIASASGTTSIDLDLTLALAEAEFMISCLGVREEVSEEVGIEFLCDLHANLHAAAAEWRGE